MGDGYQEVKYSDSWRLHWSDQELNHLDKLFNCRASRTLRTFALVRVSVGSLVLLLIDFVKTFLAFRQHVDKLLGHSKLKNSFQGGEFAFLVCMQIFFFSSGLSV